MEFKRLLVRNIDERATAHDLSDLFGFNADEQLRKWCFVEIREGNDKLKFARVICPTKQYQKALKLHGIEFFGKHLKITDGDTPDPNSAQAQKQPKTNQKEKVSSSGCYLIAEIILN